MPDPSPHERRRGFATRAIHGAVLPPVEQATPSVPLFQTSTFRFDTAEDYAETIAFRRPGYTYTRGYGNPTVLAFERLMAGLEGAPSAFGFARGMAAIHTVATALARSADRVVASSELYGGSYALFRRVLPRYGIDVVLVDAHDPEAVSRAIPGAAFFYAETIANPNVTVPDLELLGRLCREAGVTAVVDNTFASPYLCTPATYGLELRMERHSASGLALARSLEGHPKVERVRYPGLASDPDHEVAERLLRNGSGGMVSIEVAGGIEGGARFCDALELAWIATSLGGTHTLVGHPASTTHRQMDAAARRAAGVADGLVRISVGLEDVEDLIEDVDRALEKV